MARGNDARQSIASRDELEALVELNQRILEALPGGVLFVDADGRIRNANREALRILDTSIEALTARGVGDVSASARYADGRPCPVAEYPVMRALATGEPQGPVIIGREREDGSVFWAAWAAVPVRDAGTAAVTGAVVTFIDLSEQKRIESELRESKARLRSILESAPNMIVSCETDGTIRYANRFQLPRDQVIGTKISHYATGEDRAKVEAYLTQVVESRAPVYYEMSGPGAEGLRRYSVAMGPIVLDGVVSGITVIVWDVTEQQALQARLIASDRLATVGILAASVAHEINNPLTYVLGGLRALDAELGQSQSTAPLRQRVERIAEGAERIRLVAADLRRFSNAPRDELRLVEVKEILESALRMASGELRQRAQLACDYGQVPKVAADGSRLGQVFLNLVVNALQAIPAGAPDRNVITVRTFVDDTGDEVIIEVSDTGVGLSSELRAQVFEPFVTTKPSGQGSGLGLYISANIVRSLGGALELDSRAGHGTTARVRLPAQRAGDSSASQTELRCSRGSDN